MKPIKIPIQVKNPKGRQEVTLDLLKNKRWVKH